MVRKVPTEVECPECGASFALEAGVLDRLQEQWRVRSRASLLRELAPEIERRAQAKAERLAAGQLREKDEEVREARKKVAAVKRDMTKLQRRMPPERAQELGVVRQETLADTLRSLFPWDRFEGDQAWRSGCRRHTERL